MMEVLETEVDYVKKLGECIEVIAAAVTDKYNMYVVYVIFFLLSRAT